MKPLKILQESFPYYLNDDRKNTLLAVGHALVVIVFLLAFHPMQGIHLQKVMVIGVVIFIVLYACIIGLPKLLPRVFDALTWTTGKYMLFTLCQYLLIGILGPIAIKALGIMPEVSFLEILLAFLVKMPTYGGVSILLITILLRNAMLKNNLRNAVRANLQLDRINELKSPGKTAKADRVTIQSDTSETIDLHLSDLLYVEASDNYSTLYWKNGNGLEKKVLRINLKNMEAQLNNGFIVRCHRSYIVNINAITHVRGNANGYKLNVRDTEITVPVSRAKGKEVIEKIGHIKNLAESA
ncbi:MAG TPA: LytTR family transcriptional regulator DNA-binding domain-containing protein [Chryseolinea sp.]|nr:LytTR family transcriptional regulator DNA-binding domain-containing protein [Chryseolinea sp.]